MLSSELCYNDSLYVWTNLWSQIKSVAMERESTGWSSSQPTVPCTRAGSTLTSLLPVLLTSQKWMGWFVRAIVLLEGGVSPWQPAPSLARSSDWQRALSLQDRGVFTLSASPLSPGLTPEEWHLSVPPSVLLLYSSPLTCFFCPSPFPKPLHLFIYTRDSTDYYLTTDSSLIFRNVHFNFTTSQIHIITKKACITHIHTHTSFLSRCPKLHY